MSDPSIAVPLGYGGCYHTAKQNLVSAYFSVLLHPHCNTSIVLSVSAVTRSAQEGDEGLAVRSVM